MEMAAAVSQESSARFIPYRVTTGSGWWQRPPCSQGMVLTMDRHTGQQCSREPLKSNTPLLDYFFFILLLHSDQNILFWLKQATYPTSHLSQTMLYCVLDLPLRWVLTFQPYHRGAGASTLCSTLFSLLLPSSQGWATCTILLPWFAHWSLDQEFIYWWLYYVIKKLSYLQNWAQLLIYTVASLTFGSFLLNL